MVAAAVTFLVPQVEVRARELQQEQAVDRLGAERAATAAAKERVDVAAAEVLSLKAALSHQNKVCTATEHSLAGRKRCSRHPP